MKQPAISIIQLSALILASGLSSAPAFAVHASYTEIPLASIFKIGAKAGRDLSSATPVEFSPSISFKKAVVLNSKGEAILGKNCFLRNTSSSHSSGSNYVSSALTRIPGGRIESGIPFSLSLQSIHDDSMQILIHTVSKSGPQFELSCAHPNIAEWSISDFETSTRHSARVRVPASLAQTVKDIKGIGAARFLIQEMKGSILNGLFGSGLPGTAGIQLLLGANLRAFAKETDATLMLGKRCKLVSQSAESLDGRYQKGAKFAFREYQIKNGKVELIFDNWNHSPHQVRVECKGTEQEVKNLSVAEVARDLNGTVQFYQK
jgi:hypothetical protein